ncbi:unnamed protein product [Macrosiphum euphorbiae]|uniref:Uncharacterized protein n=1 Tax=Macrosiphum euphorbiae TaxID=13131 RepID=A0AAV0XRB4_9HEMI|nr:unnamed protein product [Macrosiphum euphorbiae]
MYNTSCASTSTLLDNSFEQNLETDSLESSDISELETSINSLELIELPTKKKKCRLKINFITPKLAGALDRCQLSIRDSVYVLQPTLEALNFNTDGYVIINQTSIHRARESYCCERGELIKLQFKKSLPNYAVVHWMEIGDYAI